MLDRLKNLPQLENQSNEPYLKKILITPDLANEFLINHEENIKINPEEINRDTKKDRVELYCREMIAGRWKENTFEPLQITKNGRITQGKHRLTAVAKSGVSIYFHIVFNALDDVFDVLDTGYKRSTVDVFEISMIKNGKGLPSMIQTFFVLSNGGGAVSWKNKMTNSQMLDKYNEEPELWQTIHRLSAAWYHKFGKVLNGSLIGGLYAFLMSIDSNDAYSFMNQLCEGRDIENNSILLLRTKLIQDRMAVRKMPQTLKVALIIKAWNCYRSNNHSLKMIKFDMERDIFPKAI